MADIAAPNLDLTLSILRAAAEETRLRILALLTGGGLSVSDLTEILGPKPIRTLLDLGTGTGRMLQLLGPRAARVVGLDASHAMLSVARANLEKAGLTRVELRQGDIYAPPFPRNSFDLVIIHQVLHYLDDPARAIREAARLVAPGGRLLVIDFAPHGLEFLREKEGHRRLGFAPSQV